MAFPPRHTHRAAVPVHLRLLAALLSACLVLAFPASPALAHDSLKRSSPAENAEVATLDEIELEYTASVKFPFVVLHDAAGEQLPLDEPKLDGPVVTARVPQPLAPGSYTIAWRVVSSDGHPIEGEIPFTVQGSPSAAPSDTSAAPSSTGEAAAAPSTDATAGPQGDAAAGSTAQAGVPAWIWGVLAVLVVLGVLVWLRTARRAPEEAPTPAETDAD